MSEQFSILLGNHSRLEAGQTDGVWLSMPATTEQLHDAMRNIGVTAENPQDLFVGGFANTEQCPFDVPLSVIQSGSIDELNYLGKLLEMQRDEDKAKFAAAVTLGEYAGNLKDLNPFSKYAIEQVHLDSFSSVSRSCLPIFLPLYFLSIYRY